MTSNGCPPHAKNEIIFIRQESKVQKIEPDDENDPFLKKERGETKTISRNCRPPNLKTFSSGDDNENEINNAKELKVNGNVVIYMPPNDEPCTDNIKYRDPSGMVTPVSFDELDGLKFPKVTSKEHKCCLFNICTKQTCINILLGLICLTALGFTIVTFIKSKSSEDGNMYCYPCESVNNIEEKYRKEDMCCISEPLKNFQDEKVFKRPGVNDELSTYNGSRIIEFEADFQRQWETLDTKSTIWWSPSGSLDNSFVSYQSDSGSFYITHTATYVITVSLTTDSYSSNLDKNYIRMMVCLVFENSSGRKTEECRPVTHTKIMNIPFQIVKYRELKSETKVYVTITSEKILPKGHHNKLYIVMI